ncbi:MAG: hypothetical protein AAFR81_11725 [Chloroflexota bacterium]
MQHNHALWKALHSLAHSLSVLAILVLLLNDHWLRYAYPSWLTGKLGDFTWLLFAPFVLAIVLAMLIPSTVKKQAQKVGIISIVFIGVWFATAKTIPTVHWLTTETLYALVGYRGTLRMDITDLLTLPALLLSWWIWQRASTNPAHLKPIVYIAFGLGILGTLATSPRPYPVPSPPETVCENPVDGSLVTLASYTMVISDNPIDFVSTDAGNTWQENIGIQTVNYGNLRCGDVEETIAIHPTDSTIQYRWQRDAYIERSTDAGNTWERIHELPELDQDVRMHGNHGSSSLLYNPRQYELSPVSGIVHSETGNLILAMSMDGMLVITPDLQSQWVRVGEYHLDDLSDLQGAALHLHVYLLVTLWFLIFVTVMTMIHSQKIITKLWLWFGWWIWLFLIVMGHGYGSTFIMWGLVALVSLIVIAIPMSLWALIIAGRHYGQHGGKLFLIAGTTSLLASMGYLFPLILWTRGTIPHYYMTAIFSLLLVACVLASCYAHFRSQLPARHMPEVRKAKPKRDAT